MVRFVGRRHSRPGWMRQVQDLLHYKLLTGLNNRVGLGGMSTVISNDDAKRIIAANVRRSLAERKPDWTQSDLARATGDNVMTISHLIRGTRCPSAALLKRVAEALGVSSDALLTPTAEAISQNPA